MNLVNKAFKRFFPQFVTLPKNIKVLYLITFLGELYLIIPIWMFFYLRFLSYEQIALITIIQQMVAILFEVPTGAFADLFGKKITLIISYVLYAISLFFMPFGSVFAFFVVLEVLKGVAKALYSGSFEALTYDALKDEGREEDYPAISANFVTISWFGYIVAGILGGVLYDIWFGLPYIALAILYAINVVLFVRYSKEPTKDSAKVTLKNYVKQNLNGFKELFGNVNMTLITLIFVFITLGYFTASELLGISQGQQYGLSGTQVGLLFTVGYIFSVALSNLFPRLLKKFTVLPILLSTTTALLISFLLAKFVSPVIGASLIVLRISSSSTFSNLRSVVLNKNISSKNRSTALSSFSLIYELGYVCIAYFAGIYIGEHSPNEFAFIIGVILLAIIAVLAVFLWTRMRWKRLASK